MSALLQLLHLAPVRGRVALSGLVSVKDNSLPPSSIPEMAAKLEAASLENGLNGRAASIDYIFFRRFNDGRSPQVAAFVVDNSRNIYTREQVAMLHHRVWLNGSAPLLYVEWPSQVDILRCAVGPEFWSDSSQKPIYNAADDIKVASDVSTLLDAPKINRFSALGLATGTFWETTENAEWACANQAAHKKLIDAVIAADKNLNGERRPVIRRLLLLFIFIKYLEDRGVFPKKWFRNYSKDANSFLDVLKSGGPKAVLEMLDALKERFQGDLFDFSGNRTALNSAVLNRFVYLIEAETINKQRYLWERYSFRYIAVEVFSHLYQHFAQSGTGAIYTPPFVAELMLDQILPYEGISFNERILDPTCGSGVFLVGAFRRLVYRWQDSHNWNRPGVSHIKEMLKRSVYGVDELPGAIQVATLNLALAVCDALEPRVIWNNLKFDTLVGRNLFQGDFFKSLSKLKNAAPGGFTAIIGNPPFSSKLTPAAKEVRSPKWKDIAIPDKNIAYQITEECADLLADSARLCLLQPSGFLYNANPRSFASRFIRSHTVETILDFVSIRNLFESADTKAIALVVRRKKPTLKHRIWHLTFRKTKSVHERIGFELDHYDLHYISQEVAETSPWIWKVNLLGGGRLASLTKKIMGWPTLEKYLLKMGWTHGEGFIVGRKSSTNKSDWLYGKPFLPTDSLTNDGICSNQIETVTAKKFVAPRKPERFMNPMFLIRENAELPSALWTRGPLTFLDKIVGINAPENDLELMVGFAKSFERNKTRLKQYSLLKSTQSLVGKSTAILKRDIEELPWPIDEGFQTLAWWEEILLSDASETYAPLIRIGQKALAITKPADEQMLESYSAIFVRLLGSVYTNLRPGKWGVADGIAYQSFTFGDSSELGWPDDWAGNLKQLLTKNRGVALRTHRIIRFYEANTMIILKTNRMRNWIPSTAIRDADETLVDLQKQGF